MRTNLIHVPKYTVDVSTLQNPTDIMHFCQQHDIVAYVYKITHSGMALKYGYSMGSTKRAYLGERIYRQIGRSPVEGWTRPLTGPNSDDFIDTCNEYTLLTSNPVNRNNMLIDIYDMTKYPFECDWDPSKEVRRLEAEFIDLHRQYYGRMPFGNIDPALHALNLNIDVTSAALGNLFDYTPQTILIPA